MAAVKGFPGSLDQALKPFEILHGIQGNSAKMVVLGFSKDDSFQQGVLMCMP
jgi:hypothetical protein